MFAALKEEDLSHFLEDSLALLRKWVLPKEIKIRFGTM